MIKLGFDTHANSGSGIFHLRLKRALERLSCFSAEMPDVWLYSPSLQGNSALLPPEIEARRNKGETKVITRMGGCHCTLVHFIQKPFVIPNPILDRLASQKYNHLKNAVLRKSLMEADDIVFQSDFARRLTQQFVCQTQPGAIIYNGLPMGLFDPEGPVDTSMSGRLNVLIAHHFRPFHRLHEAFKILAHLKKTMGTYCHFHIVGGDDGQSIAYALEIARKLHLKPEDDYTLWGKLSADYTSQVYRSCDLMLNLSYWEAAPNSIIEAMACGMPVVGVNSGAIPEWVGEAGLMVDETIPMDYLSHNEFKHLPKVPVAQYAAAILNVLGNLEEYRSFARQRAQERFDILRIAKQYIALAEKICAASDLKNDVAIAAQ